MFINQIFILIKIINQTHLFVIEYDDQHITEKKQVEDKQEEIEKMSQK
jgi:hypothetical protein